MIKHKTLEQLKAQHKIENEKLSLKIDNTFLSSYGANPKFFREQELRIHNEITDLNIKHRKELEEFNYET